MYTFQFSGACGATRAKLMLWSLAALFAFLGAFHVPQATALVLDENGEDQRSAEKDAEDTRIPGQYIVVFKDSVKGPASVARAQTEQRDGKLGLVYRHALKGYSAKLSKDAVEALRKDPRVKYVTPDHWVEAMAQTTPTGIERIAASTNSSLDIDEEDDVRIDVDVAVIDTGIDHTHPDLNVVGRTNCVPPGKEEEPEVGECVDSAGIDDHGHGTHVAGTIGAIDNGEGVVGVAPGARLWAVKVLTPNEYGQAVGTTAWIIAGVDWVTGTRQDENAENDVDVANLSLGCACEQPALEEAISASTEEGVVYAVAAGNSALDAESFSPAKNPDVITVAALADYDGKAGSEAGSSCYWLDIGQDDHIAAFSNYGDEIELMAPGTCIDSTLPGGKYGLLSGTSMASPHVAGAAAVLASEESTESKADVEAIRDELIGQGSLDWSIGDPGNSVPAPLLYLGDTPLGMEAAVAPASAGMSDATVWGAIMTRGVPAEFQFEHGLTSAYGQKIPTPAGEVSGGSPLEVVTEEIEDLDPGAQYHYRLTATNENQTVKTAGRTYAAQISPPTFSSEFGGEYGNGNGQLLGPNDIAVDSESNLWIVDTFNTRVQKFNSKGEYLDQFGEAGEGNGQFSEPTGIALDSEGNLWVVDGWTSRVQKFNAKGEYLDQFGKRGSGNGQFVDPFGIDIDSSGNIWIADWGNHRVQKFNSKGEYLDQFGKLGGGRDEFHYPTDVAVDSAGDVWVADSLSNRVQKFTSEGDHLKTIGASGTGNRAGATGSGGIAIDFEDNIWVVDHENGRVQQFNSSGELLSGFGEFGEGPGKLHWPLGIGIDPKGSIWVADYLSSVRHWVPSAKPVATTKPVNPVTHKTATLRGAVDPEGTATEYRFEYGETTDYGNTIPIGSKAIGSGTATVEVSEAIEGLELETSYHFRVVARSAVGTSYGADMEFTTKAAPKWTIQSPGSSGPGLISVSCVSTSECVAVGGESARRWNGSEWKNLTPAKPAKATSIFLGDVSCASSTVCVATGQYQEAGGKTGVLVEHWNGSAWSLATGVMPAEATGGLMNGVSCTSTTACFGVGQYSLSGGKTRTLAASWNGEKWSVISSPFEEGGWNVLGRVSCTGATSCTAHGFIKGQLKAYRWNGSEWSALANGFKGEAFGGLSCTSANACIIAGGDKAEHWNGTKWTSVTLPMPEEAIWMEVQRVSCATVSACTAVGSYSTGAEVEGGEVTDRTYAARWDGSTWSLQETPNPAEALEVGLPGVSCPAVFHCTAVGSAHTPEGQESLYLRYE